jgi:transcription termination factor Rho
MPDLSASNLDAIQFPIRFLRAATNLTAPGASFMELATIVAETKSER